MVLTSEEFRRFWSIPEAKIKSTLAGGYEETMEVLREVLEEMDGARKRGFNVKNNSLVGHLSLCLAAAHQEDDRPALAFAAAAPICEMIADDVLEFLLHRKRDAGEELPDEMALYSIWQTVISALFRKYRMDTFADLIDWDPAEYHKLSKWAQAC